MIFTYLLLMIGVQEVLTAAIRNGKHASRLQKLKISGRVRPIAKRMVYNSVFKTTCAVRAANIHTRLPTGLVDNSGIDALI
jgi:hypothetical protein